MHRIERTAKYLALLSYVEHPGVDARGRKEAIEALNSHLTDPLLRAAVWVQDATTRTSLDLDIALRTLPGGAEQVGQVVRALRTGAPQDGADKIRALARRNAA